MSLDLIKNDKTKTFNNLFIRKYYTALSIKYLNNDNWLKKKNLRSGYRKTIVSAMIMLPIKSTFFFYLLFHVRLRPSQWECELKWDDHL